MSDTNMGSVSLQSPGGMDASGVGPDTLTSNLANMSKHQLYQLLSQMKVSLIDDWILFLATLWWLSSSFILLCEGFDSSESTAGSPNPN